MTIRLISKATALLAATATGFLGAIPAVAHAEADDTMVTTAEQGYLFGYAPVVMARTRAELLCRQAPNTLGNIPFPMNPLIRVVVAPNTDTLYTNAFLDLRDGPVTVSYPDTGGRYADLQFLDMYTEVIGNVGTRTTGTAGASATIVPPGYAGPIPEGSRRLQAGTWDVWMLGRTGIAGATQPDAAAVQRGFTLSVLPADVGSPPPRLRQQPCSGNDPQHPADAGAAFFDELADVLAADPTTDTAMLESLAHLGITPGSTPSTGPDREVLDAGVRAGQATLDRSYTSAFDTTGHWQTPRAAGHYGTDYLQRAATAKYGLAANEPAESRYFMTDVDSTATPLDGHHTYRLHLPAGDPLVPVDRARGGWWSLSMYDEDNFLVANPFFRYALGGDEPALHRNPDGSVDLTISAIPPNPTDSAAIANWLPAPAGPFHLMFRQYVPTDTDWQPPSVERM
ncbi:DUF1254 domain-containing protein [Nocardia cyriacigeorgica]|uniref:DUF1254 domain-containing protein n=1 Tax=Nocardia cyriacigeorgica TaxID=135487 RepID=UPI002457A007|nr:DUF1254 domain-containing protein [Nocardia cyriacigeorgica]